MADDIIKRHGKTPVSRKALQDAMLGLAEGLCRLPGDVQHLSWPIEQLNRVQCRAIYEHSVAGRVNYYEIDETPGVVYVEAHEGLYEWWAEQFEEHSQSEGVTDDDEWSLAKAPSDWRKLLQMPETTMRQRIKDGLLVVDKLTPKSWRIRLDTLRKYLNDEQLTAVSRR